jgi:predicted DNA-binding transcriptional regulator AlpA
MTADEDVTKTGVRKMLSMVQLLELLPVGKSTIERMLRNKEFPEAHYLSPNRRVWYSDEIAVWQDDLPNKSLRKKRRKARTGEG